MKLLISNLVFGVNSLIIVGKVLIISLIDNKGRILFSFKYFFSNSISISPNSFVNIIVLFGLLFPSIISVVTIFLMSSKSININFIYSGETY